jgi:hypothetical protein
LFRRDGGALGDGVRYVAAARRAASKGNRSKMIVMRDLAALHGHAFCARCVRDGHGGGVAEDHGLLIVAEGGDQKGAGKDSGEGAHEPSEGVGVVGPRRVRRSLLAAKLALPDRDQPLPERHPGPGASPAP